VVRSKARTISEYFEQSPESFVPTMRKMRAMIRKTAPRAKEMIGDGVPYYEVNGEFLCAFARQKQYLAFYFCDHDLLDKFKKELAGVNCGKSCIRFRKPESVSLPVLAKILKEAYKKKT